MDERDTEKQSIQSHPGSDGIPQTRSIGWAIKQMQEGRRVFRENWNGKGQVIGLQYPDSNSANTLPYIYIITVQNQRVPWHASQTDILAFDWEVAL